MIIVSIIGPGGGRALRQIRSSRSVADMLELRLDLIGKADLRPLFKAAAPVSVIATCRPTREGGAFTGSEPERLSLIEKSVALGASYIDIEVDVRQANIAKLKKLYPSVKVICSHHLKPGEEVDPLKELARLSAARPDVLKFAYHTADSHECRHAFEFLSQASARKLAAIAIGMGPAGEPTRVLYRKFGGWATFASSGTGEESAPGQLTARELKEVYRADRLNRRTRVYGLVGDPVSQSMGPHLHNAQFGRSGINAVYCRFLTQDLQLFVRRIGPFLSGASITLPHKERMIHFLQSMDRRVRRTGAVNTVIFRNGRLTGKNTDAPAALDVMEKVRRVAGRTVLVIGAGGAARAVIAEALARDARVIVAGRNDGRAVLLATELGAAWIPWERVQHCRGKIAEIVVNTTPVGMVPETARTPVPRKLLQNVLAVDAIYNPAVTRFLRDARAQGSRIVSGMEWFIAQAVLQSKVFGVPQPDGRMMREIFERRMREQ